MSSPVIVAGMHRSGTSLAASLVSALGVSMGEHLLDSDRHNPRGCFEDTEFLELNRRLLCKATAGDGDGHHDWGWTEAERLDRSCFEESRDAARALIGRRNAQGRRWGWKDPRTSLLLDFWSSLLDDEPLFVFVYRFPWEVADSMQRLGADEFLRHPEWAYRIWAFYNRQILDFHRRNRRRSLLLSTNALRRDPERLRELLESRFGLELSDASLVSIVDDQLLQPVEADDPLISLALAIHPECHSLLGELDAAADLPGTELWRAVPPDGMRSATASPRLSVVIPCFDQGELLIEAVASVERSVPVAYELLIVNDGSQQPRTLEVLDVLRGAGYRIVDQENGGLSAARNRGFSEARADVIVPLDADNRLRPGFIESALAILEHEPETGVVYGDRYDFGLRNGTVDVPDFDGDALLPFNVIDACAAIRKGVWTACGGYDPNLRAWEDWDFWIGAIERGWRFRHLPVVAFDYRVRPDSMSAAVSDPDSRRELYRYIIEKHRDHYWRRLPSVLMSAQHSAGELFRLAREHEQLHAASAATFEAKDRELEALNGARNALAAELAESMTALEEVEGRFAALNAAHEEQRRELDALRKLRAEHESAVRNLEATTHERDELQRQLHERDHELSALRGRSEALGAALDERGREVEALRGERKNLYRELASWMERVAFMQNTRSWKFRERMLSLRALLRLR